MIYTYPKALLNYIAITQTYAVSYHSYHCVATACILVMHKLLLSNNLCYN